MNAEELTLAIRNFLDAAKMDLSPEDHLHVLNETVDYCDDFLEAHEEGRGAACNLPSIPTT